MIYWIPPYEPDEVYPVYDHTVDLGDVEYSYTLTYRERQDGWYLDLYDADGEALVTGKRLSIDVPVLWRHVKDGMPSGGQIVVIDTANTGTDPTYEDLGYRVKLAWILEADYPDASVDYGVTIEVT
jgi:hypothetical protein